MFGNMFETYDVIFEVYIEDKLAKRQIMQAPKEILMVNFIQMAEQIKKDQRPMKIKIIRQDVIWDNFDSKQKVLNNEIAAINNAMELWEENNNKEDEHNDR